MHIDNVMRFNPDDDLIYGSRQLPYRFDLKFRRLYGTVEDILCSLVALFGRQHKALENLIFVVVLRATGFQKVRHVFHTFCSPRIDTQQERRC